MRPFPTLSVLLALVLAASGCAATRSQTTLAPNATRDGATLCPSAAAADEAPSAGDVAREVATPILIASAVAAGVIFGAHGGAITPPLHLDDAGNPCAPGASEIGCRAPTSCAGEADTASPG